MIHSQVLFFFVALLLGSLNFKVDMSNFLRPFLDEQKKLGVVFISLGVGPTKNIFLKTGLRIPSENPSLDRLMSRLCQISETRTWKAARYMPK